MQTQPTGTQTATDRSTEFVPVEGGSDTSSAEALLVTAYILIWAILLGFVMLTWKRQRRIETRLGELEAQIKQATQGGS